MKNVAYWVASAGFIAWTACFLVALNSREEIGAMGQFGDAFGVVNALFTMGAMIGASVAVVYQHRELSESRRARDSDEREQRFFQLVSLMNEAFWQMHISSTAYNERFATGHRAVEMALDLARIRDPNHMAFAQEVVSCEQWLKTADLVLDFTLKTDDSQQKQFFKEVVQAQLTLNQRKLMTVASELIDTHKPLHRKLGDAGVLVKMPV